MDSKVLNYRVIIEPDQYTGSNKPCFLAYAPTIDVADNGDTIEEALENIKEAIECRIASLIADKEPVPAPNLPSDTVVVATTTVRVPINYPTAFL